MVTHFHHALFQSHRGALTVPTDQEEPADHPSPTPSVKRPYRPPALVEYGHIAKLTHSGFGSGADGGMMANRMMMCL
jgi:hypothetical protein